MKSIFIKALIATALIVALEHLANRPTPKGYLADVADVEVVEVAEWDEK